MALIGIVRGRKIVPPTPGLGASALALVTGVVAFVVIREAGWVADSSATLVEMGFDPDRARLLASLLAGAIVAAAGSAAAGERVAGVIAGSFAAGVLFARTFLAETSDALATRDAAVAFDLVGWVLTLTTLVLTAVVAAWAAATLALSLRRGAATASDALRSAARRRHADWRAAGSGLALLLAICALGLLPVLADVLNYGPDARMRHGLVPPVALFGGQPPATAILPVSGAQRSPSDPVAGATAAVGAAPPNSTTALPAEIAARSPGGPPGPSPITTSPERPWLAWRPSGPGTLTSVQFPAPWTGGTSTVANATIYLPPGYATGDRRYPVVYEVPWNLGYWDSSVQLPAILDGLIDGGQIPPEIVAFVSLHGGPYPDSECADSADGREAADSFVVQTVVPWFDAHLRTIAAPAARTLFGFSEGGFCSANLLIRHPDVFHLAIAMSGYYEAGARGAQTLNAWRPFANDPASLAANSPGQDCATLAPDVRSQLYVALSGDPTEPFYGPEMRAFAAALRAAGIAYGWLPTSFGHRWGAVREELPLALEAVSAHQAATGVFR